MRYLRKWFQYLVKRACREIIEQEFATQREITADGQRVFTSAIKQKFHELAQKNDAKMAELGTLILRHSDESVADRSRMWKEIEKFKYGGQDVS